MKPQYIILTCWISLHLLGTLRTPDGANKKGFTVDPLLLLLLLLFPNQNQSSWPPPLSPLSSILSSFSATQQAATCSLIHSLRPRSWEFNSQIQVCKSQIYPILDIQHLALINIFVTIVDAIPTYNVKADSDMDLSSLCSLFQIVLKYHATMAEAKCVNF